MSAHGRERGGEVTTSGPVSPAPRELLTATQKPDVVEVPPRVFLSLSGAGAPDSVEFGSSVGALYGIAYGLKFQRKKTGGEDFKVGPLIGVWWAEGENLTAGKVPSRDAWRWSIQLDVPQDMTATDVEKTVAIAISRKGGKLEGSSYATRVALVRDSAQRFGRILHVGPYADEPSSFATVGSFLESHGMTREPWHVEVYISDPTRTVADRLKTVLLAPIAAP